MLVAVQHAEFMGYTCISYLTLPVTDDLRFVHVFDAVFNYTGGRAACRNGRLAVHLIVIDQHTDSEIFPVTIDQSMKALMFALI